MNRLVTGVSLCLLLLALTACTQRNAAEETPSLPAPGTTVGTVSLEVPKPDEPVESVTEPDEPAIPSLPEPEEKTTESQKVLPSADPEPPTPTETAQDLATVNRLQAGDTYQELSAYCADLVNQWTSADRETADALDQALTQNKTPLSSHGDMLSHDFQIDLLVDGRAETFHLWLDFYKEGSTAIVGQSERALPEWKIPPEQADQLRELLEPLKVPMKTVAAVYLPDGETVGEGRAFRLPYMLDYCFTSNPAAEAGPEKSWDYKLTYTSYGLSHECLLWPDHGKEIYLVEDENGKQFELAEDQKHLLNLFFQKILCDEE